MSQTKAELIEPQGNVAFDTNTLYVDAGNNRVGIGTTSPSTILQCAGGASGVDTRITIGNNGASLQAGVDGSNFSFVGTNQNQPLYFFTNGSERARIDTSGRLLVGTSSARSNFFNGFSSWTPQYQIETAGSSSVGVRSVSFTYGRSNADSPIFAFAKHRSDSVGGTTVVQSGDGVGVISFQASDGTDFVEAANISAVIDGTPGADDMPGRLVFSTTFDGQSSPTERMRIDSSGRVLISTSSSFDNTAYVQSTSTSGATTAFAAKITNSSTASVFSCNNSSNTYVGGINVSSAATAFVTSSDYRLKENVVRVTDGIARLQQLKPSRFNFIAEPAKTVDGFLAHEVQTVVPEAIFGEKDAVDEKGDPVYQSIDQAKLVPLLTAALQEAIGEIESLKARVAALESA